MCIMSMIIDEFSKRSPYYPHPNEPWSIPNTVPPITFPEPNIVNKQDLQRVREENKEEIAELRSQIQSLIKMLKAAQIYDTETGQEDCETEEKVEAIKLLIKLVGLDLEDLNT